MGDHLVSQHLQEFGLEVSKGNVPGHRQIHKFGEHNGVPAAWTTIRHSTATGLYVYLTANTALTISSDDANDTSGGTGARTVKIDYLDDCYREQTTTVTLNGQSAVAAGTDFFRIHRMQIKSVGSGGIQAGTIYLGSGALTAGVPAVIKAEIPVTGGLGVGQTLMSMYTVPIGHTLYFVGFDVSVPKSQSVEIQLMVRPFEEVFQVRNHIEAYEANVPFKHKFTPPSAEKTDIEWWAKGTAGTTHVAVHWEGFLRKNDIV